MANFEEWPMSNTTTGSTYGFPEIVPKIDIKLKVAANVLLDETKGGGLSSRNVVCSPLSLEFMLHMVAMGSRGDTLRQVLNFIGPNSLEVEEDLNLKSTNIMRIVSSQSNDGSRMGPYISFVNGVWVDQRYPLKPSYKQLLGSTYKAEVKNVDFQNQVNQVIEDVNLWVVKNTRGLINQMLSPGALTRDSTLILGNALYFKGLWAQTFDKSLTKHKDFYLLGRGSVSVPFMTSCKSYIYGATDAFKVLKLPYERGNDKRQFSMCLLLPHERDGLQNLLENFYSNPGFLHQNFELREEKLDELWIPKFKISYMPDASKTMKDMGLTLPFMSNCQDLTEMVEMPPEVNLYVSKIIHKAVIEVDEEGTEAAAVTATCMAFGSGPSIRHKLTFVADHPFMFMISEEVTEAVFFVGAVVNPHLHD